MKALILLILSAPAWCSQLEVFHPRISYRLSIHKNKVVYRDLRKTITFKSRKCSKQLFKSFNLNLKRQMTRRVLTEDKSRGILLAYQGRQGLIDLESDGGKFLITLPQTLRLKKIQEASLCD